jgi:phage tail P2-like protein
MQNDGCDQGIAEALDDLIRRSMYNVRSLKVWDEIETLNEKQLDELAWELDIDWYDSTADIDTKRDVLRYASSVKRKRGTSWSVQQLITAYFGQGFVYEWTEFDGQPFTFMALTTNDNVDEITLKKFINAVNSAKNERSKLVGVLYLWSQDHVVAELVTYDDMYHKYKIKKCGLTPHAITIGILQKGTMTVSDASQYIGYMLKGVGSVNCGRLGGHRGTLGQIIKNTILSSGLSAVRIFNYKRCGLHRCRS